MKTLFDSLFFSLISLSIFCSSCSSSGSSETTHISFKESSGDRWGIITADGEILISDEYDQAPTSVINDIFYVPTNGGFEMYNVKEPTKPIGDKYDYVSKFSKEIGVTPIGINGKPITYIDKSGKELFSLPAEYWYAESFLNGYSKIAKFDNCMWHNGVVDKEGNIFMPKKYSIIAAYDDNTFSAYKFGDKDSIRYMINLEEEELHRFKGTVRGYDKENGVYIYEEDNKRGLRKYDGDIIIRAKYDSLMFIGEKYLKAYVNGEWGLVDFVGNTIVGHKYASISEVDGSLFTAKKELSGGYGLMNIDGDRILKFEFDSLYFFNGKLLGKKMNEKYWTIMSSDGESIADYSNFSFGWFESVNYANFDANRLIVDLFARNGQNATDDLYGNEGFKNPNITQKVLEKYSTMRFGYLWWTYLWDDLYYPEYETEFGSMKHTYGYPSNFEDINICCFKWHLDFSEKGKEKITELKSDIDKAIMNQGFPNKEIEEGICYFKNDKHKLVYEFSDAALDIYIMPVQ